MADHSWKILADGLNCELAVLGALLLHLEITAFVLKTAEGGTLDTRPNHLGGGHILPTVAHNLDILSLRWWSVANFASW